MQSIEAVRSLTELVKAIDHHGFALWSQAIDAALLEQLRSAFESQHAAEADIRRADQLYARRNLLADMPEVIALAQCGPLQKIVQSVLGTETSILRALLFDKIPAANWHVGWHQDLMIPLAEKHETAGFSAWSVKAGVVHAKPPAEILQQILILRVHLDDCQADNGPLRLIAGSHTSGELTPAEVQDQTSSPHEQTCLASAGSVLAMRPLVLHSSSPAKNPSHRRVVHLEFAKKMFTTSFAVAIHKVGGVNSLNCSRYLLSPRSPSCKHNPFAKKNLPEEFSTHSSHLNS